MKTIKVKDVLIKLLNGEEINYTVQYIHNNTNNLIRMIPTIEPIIFDLYHGYVDIDRELEIIEEEKEIKKITMCTSGIMSFESVENITSHLKEKINELTDEVNELKRRINEKRI